MGEGRSPRSVARLVACVRGFYRFLALHRHVADNPADRSGRRRARGRCCRSSCRSTTSIGCCTRPTSRTPRGLRDRALIEVLYATGLRVSELVAAAAAGPAPRAGYLTTTGKGRKQRIVPVGDEAAAWVTRYVSEARPALLGKRSLAATVRQRARRRARHHARRLLEDPEGLRQGARPRAPAQPARAAALVCHASARARRRPARDPDDARPRRSVDDADLHAHPRRAHARALRSVPSAGLTSPP